MPQPARRNLLQAIGAGAALLPLLEADRADAACLVAGIKRLYILVWPDGMLSDVNAWSPPGDTRTSWTLAPFQSALQPYMSDLLLLQGVDYKFIRDMPGSGERSGHACFPGMLTGKFYQTLAAATGADLAGGPSIDQCIGSQLQQAHGYKGLVSLNQGGFLKSTGHLSWKGPGQVVLPYNVFPRTSRAPSPGRHRGRRTAVPRRRPRWTTRGSCERPFSITLSKI